MRTALAIAALGLLACGPNNEKNCESFCEMYLDCVDGATVDDVGPCEKDCLSRAEKDDKCADATDEFMNCAGGSCPGTGCASEATHMSNECQ